MLSSVYEIKLDNDRQQEKCHSKQSYFFHKSQETLLSNYNFYTCQQNWQSSISRDITQSSKTCTHYITYLAPLQKLKNLRCVKRFHDYVKLQHAISNSYTMGCPPVHGDNPRALASGLSYVQVDKHGIIILYQLHQCRPCTARDISC